MQACNPPEKQQCKKVIAWSGDFGMDQYVSWSLLKEELNLETIWESFEELCKLQSNEVRAHFDLLTSFHQGNKSRDEWYNTAQGHVNLASYPPLRLQRSCIMTSLVLHERLKILFQEQSMRAVLTYRNFLQAKCTSLQRNLRGQRPLQGTSGR